MCFGDEEVITVGSSAYNLAGDVISRGNFMKNNILNMLFSGAAKTGFGKGIVDAHIAGPANTYTRFFKWAEASGFNDQVGNLGGLIYGGGKLTDEGFAYLVPAKPTHKQRAITFSISGMDLNLIALEWIINNAPENRNNSFKATLEKVSGTFTGKILITYTSGGTVSFTPTYNLVNNMPFAYLYHEECLPVETVDDTGWVTGVPPEKVNFSGSPQTTIENVLQNKTITTVTSYSNGTPTTTSVVTESVELPFTKTTGTYTTEIVIAVATATVVGVKATVVQNEESFYNVLFTSATSTNSIIIDGVVVTITVTVATPKLEVYWKYQKVTNTFYKEKWLPYLLKIYQKGSDTLGDTLLFGATVTAQKFYPVIPVRRDNVMVDLENFPEQYQWNRKAFRKCFGSRRRYNTIIDSLADNPSLADIDHAWVLFGVSLSTQQQDGKKYLFEFFKNLADSVVSEAGVYRSLAAFAIAWQAFLNEIQLSTNDEEDGSTRPVPPKIQEYIITINASEAAQDWLYNTSIKAKGGNLVVGSGYHIKSLNRLNQCWAYAKGTITLDIPDPEDVFNTTPVESTIIAFGKQVSADIWVEYEFFDLVHINNVYQGITVTTLGKAVIASDEETSSFIIPLHENVFSDLTLVRRTQLSMECSFLVVNYYDKQTIPWYASGFFQIIVIVAIIVIAVTTGYIDPNAVGLFGANAAVGATLGFTGLSAVVAGAIANAVAAAIVSALITKAATAAFGEEVGKIIGFVAAMATIHMMTSDKAFSLADSWTQLTKSDNLIKLTLSGASEYGNYLQTQAAELNAQTQALMAESNAAMKEINKLTQELLSNNGIDSSTITDALRYATENSAQFISRTTMTGTEIAELSIKLVEDFPAPQLKLPYLD